MRALLPDFAVPLRPVRGVTGIEGARLRSAPVPNQAGAARGLGPLAGQEVTRRLGHIGGRFFPGEVSYGATKAAQVNYTMPAAMELAPCGITAT